MLSLYQGIMKKLVRSILGPAISSLTKQAFSMAEESKIPTISASATDDMATFKADGKTVQSYGYKIDPYFLLSWQDAFGLLTEENIGECLYRGIHKHGE